MGVSDTRNNLLSSQVIASKLPMIADIDIVLCVVYLFVFVVLFVFCCCFYFSWCLKNDIYIFFCNHIVSLRHKRISRQ